MVDAIEPTLILKSQYTVRNTAYHTNCCEATLTKIQFFGDASFLYQHSCLGDSTTCIPFKKVLGHVHFVNDTLLRLQGRSDSLIINIKDSVSISILRMNQIVYDQDYTLGFDTTNYSFK
jgi:hypothetical protein